MDYLTKFATHSQYEAFASSTAYTEPNVSYCEQDDEVHYNKPHDYSQDYLTFVALEAGTFKLSGNSVSYSLDNGNTWSTLASNTDSPTVPSGSSIMWKATLTPSSSIGIGTFVSTCGFDVEGNPMSLLYGDNFTNQTSLNGKNNAFRYLLSGNTNVKSVKNMSLVATTLSEYCYSAMFKGCTNLIIPPLELQALSLANYCYHQMFAGCSSLTTAPKLLATTLAPNCYNGMFMGCSNLKTSPVMLATTLAQNCCYAMFHSCSSMTTSPTLHATTLVSGCYGLMFNQCTSLNYIKAMFTTEPSTTYTSNWVYGVASSGTFVKNSAATWNVSGENGIPNGWTVQTASS